MRVIFSEPVSPRYIYINSATNKVHLMVSITGGQEISTDNTCRATAALQEFFEGGATRELNAYKEALLFDMSLLPEGNYKRAKKEGRLSQIEAYIKAVVAMEQGYMDSINAFFATPSNLYSVQLRPYFQDPFSTVVNPVFTVNRKNNLAGTPSSALYNKLHEILPSVSIYFLSPKDKLISAVQSQVGRNASFDLIQQELSTQALALLGIEIDFTKDKEDCSVTKDSIDRLMMFNDATPKDYIVALLGVCAVDIWDTLPTPPFYSFPQDSRPEERTEGLSILVQFFLANLNVYSKSRDISDENFGAILDASTDLSHELVESIWTALSSGDDVEDVFFNFFNTHQGEFGLSRPLGEVDLVAIRDKFERSYRTVTATKENSHMDDFMILDVDAQGNSAKVVTHQGHLCVNFAEIVSEDVSSANPGYFEQIKEDFEGHPINLSPKNEHILGEVKVDVDSLVQTISEEVLARLPQNVMEACRAHPRFKARQFLVDVAKGRQDEVEALLTENPKKTQAQLQTPGCFTDYSGRTFNCTAYEYAYWAKDTHMCRMLETYMDEETKALMLARIDAVDDNGLSYKQHGAEHSSVHFDLTELKTALQDYVNGYGGWGDLGAKDEAWQAVGKAQRNVPAHVAQEYCRRDRSFSPCPRFNEPTLPRVLTFFNMLTGQFESWFPLASLDPMYHGIGYAFSLRRGAERYPDGTGLARRVEHDLAAITRLDEVRTAEIMQLHENLRPSVVPYRNRISM